MHVPVMLAECLEYLAIRPDGIYLDATAGLGGHTGAIAARLTSGFVIANDRDAESLELAQAEHCGMGGSNSISPRGIFGIALGAGRTRGGACGRIAGGPGRQPLSTDGTASAGFR